MASQADCLWELVSQTFFGTRDDFFDSLVGWEILEDHGSFMLHKGPEFHWVPNGRLTRSMIKDAMFLLIDQYGYATTKTPIEDVRQQRFNERIGFIRTGEDDEYIHYRLENLHL